VIDELMPDVSVKDRSQVHFLRFLRLLLFLCFLHQSLPARIRFCRIIAAFPPRSAGTACLKFAWVIVSTAAHLGFGKHGYGRATFFVYAYPDPAGDGVRRSTGHGGGCVSAIAHGQQLDPRPVSAAQSMSASLQKRTSERLLGRLKCITQRKPKKVSGSKEKPNETNRFLIGYSCNTGRGCRRHGARI